VNPVRQFPTPPASAIDPISDHRSSDQHSGAAGSAARQAALASSAHSLAFTGSPIALRGGVGLGLLLGGLALCLVRRRVTA
jgi:hypothetical protein